MKKKPSEPLPRREREVLDAVFALQNRATAENVRAHLAHPPSYSAVRAMLVRLENKGYLKHQVDGLRYVYSATASPAAARRAALQQYLRTFFGGSLGEMVTALVRQEDWTDQELAALRTEIERVRKERRQS